MLISTGRPLPRWSSMIESEFSVPESDPTWSASLSVRDSPARLSEPVISQFVPAEVSVVAGSATDLLSLPFSQKYVPAVPASKTTTTTPMISAIRRPCRPGCPQNRQRRPPPPPRFHRSDSPPPGTDRLGGWLGHAPARFVAAPPAAPSW